MSDLDRECLQKIADKYLAIEAAKVLIHMSPIDLQAIEEARNVLLQITQKGQK